MKSIITLMILTLKVVIQSIIDVVVITWSTQRKWINMKSKVYRKLALKVNYWFPFTTKATNSFPLLKYSPEMLLQSFSAISAR